MNTRGRIGAVAGAALLAAGAMALLRAPAQGNSPVAGTPAAVEDGRDGPAEDAPAQDSDRASPAPADEAVPEAVGAVPAGWAVVESEESASIVRPLISAIRGEFPSDDARRAAMLSALRASGTTDEAWTAMASSTFAGFRHAMRDVGGVAVDAVRTQCFRAGCEATVVFDDEGAYRAAAGAFRELKDEDSQLGGRVQTPAVRRADGRFEGSWIVLRPG
jgi:hypothetical protein